MKILCWNCRGIGNPEIVHELKKMLVANDPDVIFLCETKINANKFSSVPSKCKMEGCWAVNANGKSGGLVMMWKESNKVEVQTYSSNHIDSIIHLENDNPIRDDFNAIFDNAKKRGGSSKPSALIEDFQWVVDELSMVDLKTDNGCFPFMETKVICQSTSDHDAIILDTKGRKLRERLRDPRLYFKYDVCWAKDEKAKKIIKEAWQKGSKDIMGKIEIVGKEQDGWQYKKLKQMHN
ncbi:hypothetical protein GOBAR_AA13375 [Gossypium barbadense]|uniref:Endonuclease/exonuclease/phosphatase domain-containing protein n=1 Tax=Gossypium barbadense TaxID=3634 RepID=A0A2P5XVA1_GOSBA|nr:hypothetical protein GOBAR_AA13375 [Gossypium barbadense]